MEPKKEKPKIALGYDNPETEDVEVIFFDSDDLIGSVITDAAIDPERLALTQLTLKLRDGRELLILPSEFEDIAVYYKGKIPKGSEAMTEKLSYLVFYFDPADKMWHDTDGIFETEEEAKAEIRDLIDDWPEVWSEMKFETVPNDGKAQAKYRPLDRGDRILYK